MRTNNWVRFDGEVTGTHARFKGFDTIQAVAYATYLAGGLGSDPLYPLGLPGTKPGNYLTLAPVWVATGGIEFGEKTGWFSRLSYRYFGARPLTEDGQIQSPATGTLNARIGYRFTNGWKIVLDGFNIANSRSDMIDYPANVFGRQDFALFPGYTGGSALASRNACSSRSIRRRSASPSPDRCRSMERRLRLRCRSRRRAFLIINKSARRPPARGAPPLRGKLLGAAATPLLSFKAFVSYVAWIPSPLMRPSSPLGTRGVGRM